MENEADLKTVKKMLRSVLLGEKDGVKARMLLDDYYNLTFKELPFKKLGFSTLEQFIRSIPDVVRVARDHHGNSVYHGVPEESTEQIHRMVQSQRPKKEKKRKIPLKPSARRPIPRPYRPSFRPSRHDRRPPLLPVPRNWSSDHVQHPSSRRSPDNGAPHDVHVSIIPNEDTTLQIQVKNQKRIVVNKRDMVRYMNTAVKDNSTREKAHHSEKYEIAPRFLKQQEQQALSKASRFGNGTTGFSKIDDGEKYAELLFTYCEARSLLPVDFTTWPVTIGKNTGYQSFLILQGEKFGYKDTYLTSEDAEFSAAKCACLKLKLGDDAAYNGSSNNVPERDKNINVQQEQERKVYFTPAQDKAAPVKGGKVHAPVPESQPEGADNEELQKRIKEILKSKTNGLWATRIPVEYKEKYGEAPPGNLSDIMKCTLWKSITKVEPVAHTDREIVYPVISEKMNLNYKIDPPDKLPLQEKVTVYVTFIYDPGYFCVQREESCINYIQDGLEDYCVNSTELQIDNLEKGMYCAAKYLGSWSRAEIVSKSSSSVNVLYVDYGNLEEDLSAGCLKPLSKVLSSEPAQAVKCSLYRTEPIEEKWCEDSIKKLFGLVKEEPLIALTHHWNEDVCEVELFFPDNQHISINQLLVQDGLASVPLSSSGSSSRTPSEIDESERTEPDPIQLPEDNQWDVFVSFIDQSTEAVFIRLIGEQYSDKLEEFEGTLEELYNAKNIDSELTEGIVCIALSGELCWRVRILSIEDEKALCHFLDHGDKETVPLSALKILDPAVNRTFPYQAIQCSLHNLEDVSQNPKVLEKLFEMASAKTCIAHIISRDNIISLVLIDTHGDEDININDILLKCMMEDLATMKLSGLTISEESPDNLSLPGSSGITTPSEKLLKLRKSTKVDTELNVSPKEYIQVDTTDSNSDVKSKNSSYSPNTSIYTWNSNTTGRNQTDSDSGIMVDVIPNQQPVSKTENFCDDSLSNNFSHMTVISHEDANVKLFRILRDNYDVNVYKELKSPPTFKVPPVGELLDVHISWISDCSNFVCLPYETLEELNDLMDNLNAEMNKRVSSLSDVSQVADGQIYAVFHESLWYRAMVRKIMSQGLISVYLVDFGEYSVVGPEEMKPLPEAYWSFPMQAIKSKLAGIEPVGDRAWSEAAKYKFIDAANQKDLISLVCHKDSETDVVSLKLVDTSHTTNDLCVHEDLIRCGYAKPVRSRLKD